MAEWIRPGPTSIAPGQCPGGVVIHVYAVPSGELVVSQRIRRLRDVERAASMAAALAGDRGGTCLVGYDGDTGERYGSEAWGARA